MFVLKESPNAYLILMGQKLNVKYFEFIKGNSLLSFALSYFELHVFFFFFVERITYQI
jgi:hypothetical protein